MLNFFATPSEDECKSEDGLRSGVCMNVYDCHQKGGTAKGQCALGFGACCVCKFSFLFIAAPKESGRNSNVHDWTMPNERNSDGNDDEHD